MEIAKKSRKAVRTVFTKECIKFENLIGESKPEIEIRAVFETIVKRFNDLVELDQKIYGLMLDKEDCEETELENELDSRGVYETKYSKVCFLYEKLYSNSFENDIVKSEIPVKSSHSVNYSENGNNLVKKYKLPRIELKRYDGDPKGWLQFWSQFNKIHKDHTLDNSDKYQYLIQCTVKDSRAWNVVNSYPPSAENYPKVIESLKTRFGQENMLIQVYVRELIALVVQRSAGKINMSLVNLYDRLEGHLRSLESLGVTTEKCECMLFPLVESCLPEELLRVWQRRAYICIDRNDNDNKVGNLSHLMEFIKGEVEAEEKISLAISGFSAEKKGRIGVEDVKNKNNYKGRVPTAAGLLVNDNNSDKIKDRSGKSKCLFCNNSNHYPADCYKAREMSLDTKLSLVKDNRCCFICFRPGHSAKFCKLRLKCIICGRGHYPIMCPELKIRGKVDEKVEQLNHQQEKAIEKDKVLTNLGQFKGVFLQTLIVKLRGKTHDREVRVIIDTGSQRSYILKNTALEMGYEKIGEQKLVHSLFGGSNSEQYKHNVHKIYLANLEGNYKCNFDVLDQPVICGDITHITYGPWIEELKWHGINLSDIYNNHKPVEILIGADIAGKLLTGKRIELKSGLVAIETDLGWTLIGKAYEDENKVNAGMSVVSMLIKEADVSQLWSLDTIGITDSADRKSKEDLHIATQEHFDQTVSINDEGRYEIHLPWLDSKIFLSNNYNLAIRRLQNTLNKLVLDGYYEEYDRVFQDWLFQGIIEDITVSNDPEIGHFLPHRHVIKISSTTPIRPVFDASAKEKGEPSLNECLNKGPNLMELIPEVLLRFRMNEIGATADIKQAFLQISIRQEDRKFLKFLWKNKDGIMRVYQHCRVVFGVTSSPFLLTAVIKHHLHTLKDNRSPYLLSVEKLMKSFYVDNCVTSVAKSDLIHFVDEAIMKERNFVLRDWVWSNTTNMENVKSIKVLGMVWHPYYDTLQLYEGFLSVQLLEKEVISKRLILSVVNRIYDPIGFTCPVSIEPKLLLQLCFERNYNWDQEVDLDIKNRFINWQKEITTLAEIKIPRWVLEPGSIKNLSLHTFCDASQVSYATAIFLRSETDNAVYVQLLQAKSRIVPSKKTITIPRLELLAALIGVRLYNYIAKALEGWSFKSIFWSDSSTVLAWIQRDEQWGTFVRNRVEEIRKVTFKEQWHHVPGKANPADLPSRGCSAKVLVKEKWWEGPSWLKLNPSEWPEVMPLYEEDIISEEKRRTIVTVMIDQIDEIDWYYKYFSNYESIVRMIGWIYRFIKNSKINVLDRMKGELTTEEIKKAENKLIVLIQRGCFSGDNMKKLVELNTFIDEEGIIRTKTKIALREDTYDLDIQIDHFKLKFWIKDIIVFSKIDNLF